MSRYYNEIQTSYNVQQVSDITSRYLVSEGYKLVDYNGEQVWKKGNGWMTAPSYIKISYINNKVQIEAWIKFALLPFVFVGEMGLNGFFGAIPKGVLKSRVETVIQLLSYQQQAPIAN
ncbi:MAG: hypothetical protein J1E56_07410 [Ruminococcus sp.]|nr:hypothetical protein [Ruminococcus sp.]